MLCMFLHRLGASYLLLAEVVCSSLILFFIFQQVHIQHVVTNANSSARTANSSAITHTNAMRVVEPDSVGVSSVEFAV